MILFPIIVFLSKIWIDFLFKFLKTPDCQNRSSYDIIVTAKIMHLSDL